MSEFSRGEVGPPWAGLITTRARGRRKRAARGAEKCGKCGNSNVERGEGAIFERASVTRELAREASERTVVVFVCLISSAAARARIYTMHGGEKWWEARARAQVLEPWRGKSPRARASVLVCGVSRKRDIGGDKSGVFR